tara:strand:+ start:23441 stop:24871 length:1431 start_codon:yes stop_codon:yes gene_type:complete
MALNPFFLQGSQSEQRLVQNLINEQLTIYGIEVVYLPRKIVKKDQILTEIQSSSFTDNFLIEAYINTYEGYSGAGDVLTKFGMSLKDELTVTISRERFEDFISPFLGSLPADEIEVSTRPREGDLIFFPLGKRLFEIKFVEHEDPFYQLGKNYVYQLKCELFELQDEIGGWNELTRTTEMIDDTLQDQGYITTLQLISVGSTAEVGIGTTTGYVRKIILNNDGYDYSKIPTVSISTAPAGGINATAVAITTSIAGAQSVKEILITNPGSGYTETPTVTIVSASSTITGVGSTSYGVGAAATAVIVTDSAGIGAISIASSGSGYATEPTLFFNTPTSGVGTAVGRVSISTDGFVTQVLLEDAGIGYTSGTGIATVSPPPVITGIGTYVFNELVTGSISGAKGRVKSWNTSNNILKLGTTDGTFVSGDVAIGSTSDARFTVDFVESAEFVDKYDKNDEIESEADDIIDFSESNPFGTF